MQFGTFLQSVQMLNKIGVSRVVISGGDPTEHPLFVDFMNYLTFNFAGDITVATHGKFIEDPELVKKYISAFPAIDFQITNDERYYPFKLDRALAASISASNPNARFVWKIVGELYPQGRALRHLGVNKDTAKVIATRCFNIRSIMNHEETKSFAHAVKRLESLGKFCTPSIGPFGEIKKGESPECPDSGSVRTSMDELEKLFKTSQCNDCGMLDKLSSTHHNAIGYKGK